MKRIEKIILNKEQCQVSLSLFFQIYTFPNKHDRVCLKKKKRKN